MRYFIAEAFDDPDNINAQLVFLDEARMFGIMLIASGRNRE